MQRYKNELAEPSSNLFPDIVREEVSTRFRRECKCPSVLIVDDQFINRFIIKQFCNKFGISSVEAEDGDQAVKKVTQQNIKPCCQGIELVLMDLNMPVLGGIEASMMLTDLIAQQRVNENLKIIAVTAFPSKAEKKKCLSAGISEFIVKPFTIAHFIKLIKEAS